MKEYRYKINGNLYKVTVGDIEENQVQVEVNGTPYKVELEKKATPKIKPGNMAAVLWIPGSVDEWIHEDSASVDGGTG